MYYSYTSCLTAENVNILNIIFPRDPISHSRTRHKNYGNDRKLIFFNVSRPFLLLRNDFILVSNNIVDDTEGRVGINAHPAQVSAVFALETTTYEDVFFNNCSLQCKINLKKLLVRQILENGLWRNSMVTNNCTFGSAILFIDILCIFVKTRRNITNIV